MRDSQTPADAILWLRSPAAIRRRCNLVLDAGIAGTLGHFTVDLDQVDRAAEYVVAVTRGRFPTLEIPMHSRWRHFMVAGEDRWQGLAGRLQDESPAERARSRIDLVTISVLLDAGAGDHWSYRDQQTGSVLQRSEGLALASLDLFASGALSSDTRHPLRADAVALGGIDESTLANAFQVGADNPLVGVAGRVALLRQLGQTMQHETAIFGSSRPRVGHIYDYIVRRTRSHTLAAPILFSAVMRGFSGIWPRRIELGGVNLGDVGHHPAVRTNDLTNGLVPFHKLSMWLTYSLVEPLAEAGITVTALDMLTGLAEYRNGGLMIDCGLLKPQYAEILDEEHAADSEIVTEWRALTVALLDRLAVNIRGRLGLNEEMLPLVKILEGGTWAAGRQLAAEQRPGGGPPIRVASDATIF